MNLFAISAVLTACASLGFGLFVYTADTKSRLGFRWLVLSMLIGAWTIGMWGVTTSSVLEIARGWQYLLDLSAFFIPPAYFAFVTTFVKKESRFLESIVLLGSIGLTMLLFTNLYSPGLENHELGFYWIKPGPLYFLFPLYYAVVTTAAFSFLVKAYRKAPRGSRESGQILNHIIAAAIGFSGGATDFLPQLFNVYPFGNYFVILYVVLMSYAVIRYQIFNIKLIAAQLFASGLVLASIFNLFDASSFSTWLIRAGSLAIVSIFSWQLVRSVYNEIEQRELIEKQEKILEIANHQQEALLHFISHEVKAYMTKGVGALAEIAEDGMDASQQVRDFAALALVEMREGVRTVMDILEAANLKRGTMAFNRAPCDLRAIVEQAVGSQRPFAEAKRLKLELSVGDGSYAMEGDEARVRDHVVRNLLDNAIRYTPQGGIVVALSRHDGMARLSIKDSGVGITPADQARLFTEGGHGENSIKVNVHSTGYGLYIAKQVVEAHHGKIWATSAGEGKGSEFSVEFPMS